MFLITPEELYVYLKGKGTKHKCTELTQQQRTRDMAPLIISTLDATYFHQGWIPTISCLPPHHLSLTF